MSDNAQTALVLTLLALVAFGGVLSLGSGGYDGSPCREAGWTMLQKTLRRLIKFGRLTVIRPDGAEVQFGEVKAAAPRPNVAVRLKGTLTPWKLALHPDLYFGELYMDGALVLERGTLWDLLELLGRNLAEQKRLPGNPAIGPLRAVLRRLQQSNSRRAARRHVAHHYDLSLQHYRQFLDTDLQYSCAYFADPSFSLEQAQEAKKRHIAAKLLLKPGLRVLDIGCGWGGLALSLAEVERVEVVGVTLSREQLIVARQRATQARVDDRVRFELKDYREIEGKFDRIASVGMFEHVGVPNYTTFFDKIRELLSIDGVALIHSIGRMNGPDVTSAWTRKYIFPGGYIPALSEVAPAIEHSGLLLSDMEIWRLHYAETLRHWRERFLASRRSQGRPHDERFCRMWEFYLASSEWAFRYGGLMVFQAQLARRLDSVPVTRDYLFERAWEGSRIGSGRHLTAVKREA
jgi:cyclopropane-fatty-acyl-phospholipid synthase